MTAVGQLDYDTQPLLSAALQAAITGGAHRVDVDMRGLTFCDCAGLSALLAARADAHRVGCAFGLLGPLTSSVGLLFRLGGAARALPVRVATPGAAAPTGGAPPHSP